jgi:phospholipid/cholesterol/gamma-HCH transport system substrate-binding protein
MTVRQNVAPLLKMLVFTMVTVLVTGVLAATIANSNFGPKSQYHAVFSDATGLNAGDDVRISGVRIGTVNSVSVHNRDTAEIGFDVDAGRALPATTTAVIKYRNLVGQRYLALVAQPGGDANATLRPGDVIPLSRTTPALNLTTLLNGFKPLFVALRPADINKLAYEIIQVLQGEGPTMDSLLSHTASLTSTIADKDKVIGQVIGNLNTVLDNVNARAPELTGLIGELQELVTGLAAQRKPIGNAITALNGLAGTTTDLLTKARPPLRNDIAGLRSLSGTLANKKDVLNGVLNILPRQVESFTNTASYGSWFNFYLCKMSGTVGISKLDVKVPFLPAGQLPQRCQS